ncbi:MAG: hypothetical protein QOD77_149 [Thermoplasmata archaeon]|jgi:hypothetical protein|nr:hypothetical protein [Thermoplasmata archaeon]
MRAGKTRQLEEWVEKGLISPEQRDAILEAEAPPPPAAAAPVPEAHLWTFNLFPFGRPDLRELRLPLLGLCMAIVLAALLMGADVALDEATDQEPHRVTPWAPLVITGLLLGLATVSGKRSPVFLSASLAMGMLYFTLDVKHEPLSFIVSLLFVAALPALRLPPPVRIVAAITAIPLVMLAGQRLGGTEPLAVQVVLSTADLALLAALLSGSSWRTVPYWGLVFLGAGVIGVAMYAFASNVDRGGPVLGPAVAMAGGLLLLRATLYWPRAAWDARFRLNPPIPIPDLRRPPAFKTTTR